MFRPSPSPIRRRLSPNSVGNATLESRLPLSAVNPVVAAKNTGAATEALEIADDGSASIRGGVFSPGNSPGIETVENLTVEADGTLLAEVQDTNFFGAVAGQDYDQVQVSQDVTIESGATLDLSQLGTFPFFGSIGTFFGDTYTIIDNQGDNPVDGEFEGLAEGADVSEQLGINWVFTATLSYQGGDGNDVVITISQTPQDQLLTRYFTQVHDFYTTNFGFEPYDLDAVLAIINPEPSTTSQTTLDDFDGVFS